MLIFALLITLLYVVCQSWLNIKWAQLVQQKEVSGGESNPEQELSFRSLKIFFSAISSLITLFICYAFFKFYKMGVRLWFYIFSESEKTSRNAKLFKIMLLAVVALSVWQ